MKKFVALVMALVLCLSLFPFSALATESEAESEQLVPTLEEITEVESVEEETAEEETPVLLEEISSEPAEEQVAGESAINLPAEELENNAEDGTVTEYSVSELSYNAENYQFEFTYSAPASGGEYDFGLQYRLAESENNTWSCLVSYSSLWEADNQRECVNLTGLVPGLNYEVQAWILLDSDNKPLVVSNIIQVSVSQSDFVSVSTGAPIALKKYENLRYKYTPTEDGLYLFTFDSDEKHVEVYDSTGNQLELESSDGCVYFATLTASSTYWLYVCSYTDSNNLTVKEFEPTVKDYVLSKPVFNQDTNTVTFTYSAPYSSDGYGYGLRYRPIGTSESQWNWRTYRNDTLEIVDGNYTETITNWGLVPGLDYEVQAFFTKKNQVYSSDALLATSDTITVSVSDSDFELLTTNNPVKLKEYEQFRYKFTPAEDGLYKFSFTSDNQNFNIYDSTGKRLECESTDGIVYYVTLTASNNYWLFVRSYSETNNFTAAKFVSSVQECALSKPEWNQADNVIAFTFSVPYNADGYRYGLKYRVSGSDDNEWYWLGDGDYGKIEQKDKSYSVSLDNRHLVPNLTYEVKACILKCNSSYVENYYTVWEESETISVSVSDNGFISLNLDTPVQTTRYKTLRYKFTPAEDGIYTFNFDNSDNGIGIYDLTGENLLNDNYESEYTVTLTASENYWLFVSNYAESNSLTVKEFEPTVKDYVLSTPVFNSDKNTVEFTYSAPYSSDGYSYGLRYRLASADDNEWNYYTRSTGTNEIVNGNYSENILYWRLIPGLNYEVQACFSKKNQFVSSGALFAVSDIITVSVSASGFQSLSVGDSVELKEYETLRYQFTANEDGRFTFRFANSSNNIQIYDSTGERLVSKDSTTSCTVSLKAQETCWLFVWNYAENNSLSVEEFVPSVKEFSIKDFKICQAEDGYYFEYFYSAPCSETAYACGYQYRLLGESSWEQWRFEENCEEVKDDRESFSLSSSLIPGLTYEVQAIIKVADRFGSNDAPLASSDILTVKLPGEPEALVIGKQYSFSYSEKCYCLKTGDNPVYIQAEITDCDDWARIYIESDLGNYCLNLNQNGQKGTLLEAESTYWVWCYGDGKFCISYPEFPSLSVGGSVTVSSWEDDYRQLNVTKDQVLRFTSTGQTYLELYDSNWNELQSASLSDTAEACDFVFDKSETLYLKINNNSSKDVTVSSLEYEPVVSAGDYKAVTGELTEDGYLTAQFTASISSTEYLYGIWIYDTDGNLINYIIDPISGELNNSTYKIALSEYNLAPKQTYKFQAKICYNSSTEDVVCEGDLKTFTYSPETTDVVENTDYTRTDVYALYSYTNTKSTPVVISFSSESYFYVDFASGSNSVSLGDYYYGESRDYLIPGNSTVYFQLRDYDLESNSIKFRITVENAEDALSNLGLNAQLAAPAYYSNVCCVTAKGILNFSLGQYKGNIIIYDKNLERLKYAYSGSTEGGTSLSFDNTKGDTLYVQFVNYDTEADQVMFSLTSTTSPKNYSIQTLAAEGVEMRLKVTAPVTNEMVYYGFEYSIGDSEDYGWREYPLSGGETNQIYSDQIEEWILPGTTVRYKAYYQVVGDEPEYATEEESFTFNPQVKDLAFGEACLLRNGSTVYYKYTPITDETLKLKTVGSDGGWAYLLNASTSEASSVTLTSGRVSKLSLKAGVTYYIIFEGYEYYDYYEYDDTTAVYVTKKTVANDFNGDKTVDVTDLIALIKYVLGEKTKASLSADPDLSGNGIANLLDVVKLLRVLMQKNVPA